MSKISREDILKLARLSRLRLTDEEVSNLEAELPAILSYVEVLSGVDTSGLEPTYQVTGLVNVTRADEVRSYGYEASELLKNAPQTENGQFKVRRVMQ